VIDVIDEARLYQTLGKKIRELRLDSGRAQRMTQADLANAVGLERTSITNIEKGTQKVPLLSLYRISDALKVPLDELLPSMSDVQTESGQRTADVQSIVSEQAEVGRPMLGRALGNILGSTPGEPNGT
jgi:transcriptional regulator with XRE-family HTH domain